ncbi:neurotrimin-like isoform X3 [Apostichopus japonicus]|uniref:neurotrimin-like isoform X3 n=1 Tax=Stichopus japonicus TaxID=307972 RepID=UPI003AB77489
MHLKKSRMNMKVVLVLLLFHYSYSQQVRANVMLVIGTTAIVPWNPDDTSNCIYNRITNSNNKSSVSDSLFDCFDQSQNPTEAPGDSPGLPGGQSFVVRNEGEEAIFTCTTIGFGTNDTFGWTSPTGFLPLYMWRNNLAIIGTTSKRFSFTSTNKTVWTMTISDVRKHDAGVYSCTVGSNRVHEDSGFLKRSYNLSVQYKVGITGILPNSYPHVIIGYERTLFFNETDDVELACLADGVPIPTTSWRRDNSNSQSLPSGEEVFIGRNLTITNISIHDEGLYICESKQPINKAKMNTTIVVQHKPLVRESEKLIREKKGSSVVLECQIDSDPLPFEAEWTYVKEDRKTVQTTKTNSRLYINNLDPGRDYRNYTCRVTNILGSNLCVIEITGRPAKPKIVSLPYSKKMRVYTLAWKYEEYDISQIKHFWINYTQEKLKGRPGFLDYKVPVVYNPEKPMEYNTTIYDLRANATYYVELFAYNRYGQGDIETFEFTTAAVDEPNSVSEPPPTKPLPRSYGGSGRLLQASMYTSLACFSIYLLLLK